MALRYGGLDTTEENRRYFQVLCFAQDKSTQNEGSNFYAYPLPLIPVMDAITNEIVRIDRLAIPVPEVESVSHV